VAKYIDPDLPFTEAEIQHALALMLPAEQARAHAREIARLPAEVAALTEAAEQARLRGSTDPFEINPPSWHVGDELLALLSCVSDTLAVRVDRFMEQRWQALTDSYIQGEMLRRHLGAPAEPPAEVVALARRKVGSWKGGWTRRRRRIARLVAARPA